MTDSYAFLTILAGENLRKKLFWVSSLRILSLFALLGGTVFLLEGSRLSTLVNIRQILVFAVFLCLIPAFFYFPIVYSLRNLRGLVIVSYIQVLQDMVFASLLVILTGGTSSAFTFFFFLNVIVAGILLFRKGTIFGVSLAFLFIIFMAMMEVNLIPIPSWLFMFVMPTSVSSVLYDLTINVVALASIGFLSSYLSGQIRQADIQKEELRLDLEDLRALHEHILTSLNSGLITCDRDWNIVYINPSGRHMLGIDPRNVRARRLTDMVIGIEEHLRVPDNTFELQMPDQNNSNRVMSFRISPLRPRLQEIPGYAILFDDITRLKELEAKTLAQHRLVTIGKLSAVVAHEIRNPLASVSGVMQILSGNSKLSPQEQKLVSIVIREIDHLNQWITDLLGYARPDKGLTVPMDLCKLCERVRELFVMNEDIHNIDVEFSCVGESWINGNEERLSQVITNLLKNAAEAISGAGTEDGRIRVSIMVLKAEVVCRVEDNGPGIDDSQVEQIFQPFFTTKKKGTGLGLAVVEQIVMEHEGRINVLPSGMGGACFEIIFPQASLNKD